MDFYCWFTASCQKAGSLHPYEIADVQQTKKFDQFRANFFCVDIDLDASGGITQVKKMAFAHVAMRSDTTGDAKCFTFLKLLVHFRDRSADIKTGAEWFDAFRVQHLKFFSSERDQLIFIFHIRTANVRRGACFATLNREVLLELLASTLQTNILGLPMKHLQ